MAKHPSPMWLMHLGFTVLICLSLAFLLLRSIIFARRTLHEATLAYRGQTSLEFLPYLQPCLKLPDTLSDQEHQLVLYRSLGVICKP